MKIVTKTRHETRHGLHLVLTILTFGLWAVTGWPLAWAWNVWGPRRATTTYGPAVEISATHGIPAPIASEPAEVHPWWTDARTVGKVALIALAALVILIVMI